MDVLFVLSKGQTQWINLTAPCMITHLRLVSCWSSASIRALLSQRWACGRLCPLGLPLWNRWGDCSLGKGRSSATNGDRWFIILLREGNLWGFLGQRSDMERRDNGMTEASGKRANELTVRMMKYWYVYIEKFRLFKRYRGIQKMYSEFHGCV